MPPVVVLALVLVASGSAGSAAGHAPARDSVAVAPYAIPGQAGERTGRPGEQPLLLELRIFLGSEEVTSETRVTVHRAGERTEHVARIGAQQGRIELTVPAGIYDVQAIREVEGKVANIRWAERLVVMPYPDEGGHHLEVVNFTSGFGALQIREPQAHQAPELTLYAAGRHDRPAATAVTDPDYALFVVPAGRYDVQVRHGGKTAWHTGIEVPLDRTRLWLVP